MDEFEAALLKVFNESTLPFEAKRYIVVKRFAYLVDETYQKELQKIGDQVKVNDNRGANSKD